MDKEAFIHFLGGAVGGTAGTAITCPLEVVKTRLQSSIYASSSNGPSTSRPVIGFQKPKTLTKSIWTHKFHFNPFAQPVSCFNIKFPHPLYRQILCVHSSESSKGITFWKNRNIFRLFQRIIVDEGFGALYKGLGPNLVGVAPSKAVYFYTYSLCKRFWNDRDVFIPNSAMVHMISAASAGFVAATVVNPIWLVKTRLQLHKGPLSISECIRRVFRNEGIKGFYRGVTASYVGITETVIQFVIYEHLRSLLVDSSPLSDDEDRRNKIDFMNFMAAGGTAKFFACVIAYPHEVVRTRLREEHSKAKGFASSLMFVYRGEGFRALYRGLVVQLLRTVPNTAITMGTYELVVYMLHTIYMN